MPARRRPSASRCTWCRAAAVDAFRQGTLSTMREEMANLAYPVFSYGIRLKELLANNEAPDISTAQRELLALLQAPTADREFIGDIQVNMGDSVRADFFL